MAGATAWAVGELFIPTSATSAATSAEDAAADAAAGDGSGDAVGGRNSAGGSGTDGKGGISPEGTGLPSSKAAPHRNCRAISSAGKEPGPHSV